MNKKLLTIVVFNFLIFSFQLNSMKIREIEIPKKFEVDDGLTCSPFSCGTPPINPSCLGRAFDFEEICLNSDHELASFSSGDLNDFLRVNNLLQVSIFTKEWLENFKNTEGFFNKGEVANFFDFCPSWKSIFIAAYIICNYCDASSSYHLENDFLKKIEQWFWRLRAVKDGAKANIKFSEDRVVGFRAQFKTAVQVAEEEKLDNVKKYLEEKINYYQRIIVGEISWDDESDENQKDENECEDEQDCYELTLREDDRLDEFYLKPLKEHGKRAQKKRAFNKRNNWLFGIE